MGYQTFAAPYGCNTNANLTKVYHIFYTKIVNLGQMFQKRRNHALHWLNIWLVIILSCRGSRRTSIRKPVTNAQQHQLKLNQHPNILKWLKAESTAKVQYNCVTSKYKHIAFRLRSVHYSFACMLGKKAFIHIGFNRQFIQ